MEAAAIDGVDVAAWAGKLGLPPRVPPAGETPGEWSHGLTTGGGSGVAPRTLAEPAEGTGSGSLKSTFVNSILLKKIANRCHLPRIMILSF